jgi:hypothetical protein
MTRFEALRRLFRQLDAKERELKDCDRIIELAKRRIEGLREGNAEIRSALEQLLGAP